MAITLLKWWLRPGPTPHIIEGDKFTVVKIYVPSTGNATQQSQHFYIECKQYAHPQQEENAVVMMSPHFPWPLSCLHQTMDLQSSDSLNGRCLWSNEYGPVTFVSIHSCDIREKPKIHTIYYLCNTRSSSNLLSIEGKTCHQPFMTLMPFILPPFGLGQSCHNTMGLIQSTSINKYDTRTVLLSYSLRLVDCARLRRY